MEILAPYILCVLFLAVLYGLMRLTLFFSNFFARRAVLQSGIYTPKAVHTWLIARFGSRFLLSGYYLPKDEYEISFERYDHVLFLRGAVVILTLYREGETVSAAEKKDALAKAFQRAGYRSRLPIEHILVLPTRKKGTPRPAVPSVAAPEAMRRLGALDKSDRFDKKTRKAMKKAVGEFMLTPHAVRTKRAKNRRRK